MSQGSFLSVLRLSLLLLALLCCAPKTCTAVVSAASVGQSISRTINGSFGQQVRWRALFDNSGRGANVQQTTPAEGGDSDRGWIIDDAARDRDDAYKASPETRRRSALRGGSSRQQRVLDKKNDNKQSAEEKKDDADDDDAADDLKGVHETDILMPPPPMVAGSSNEDDPAPLNAKGASPESNTREEGDKNKSKGNTGDADPQEGNGDDSPAGDDQGKDGAGGDDKEDSKPADSKSHDDDPTDGKKDPSMLQNSTAEEEEEVAEELRTEMKEEERMVRRVGGLGIFLALAAMIFTAWQMSDNPDGVYAAMCRLIITIIGLVLRLLLVPCRSCLPAGFGSGGGGHYSAAVHRHSYGQIPASNLDYGYRDPALELS